MKRSTVKLSLWCLALLWALVASIPSAYADNAIILDRNAARNSRLGRYHTALADVHVMADLNKIIYFRTFADPGLAESSAVDACICSDLDVVLDNY